MTQQMDPPPGSVVFKSPMAGTFYVNWAATGGTIMIGETICFIDTGDGDRHQIPSDTMGNVFWTCVTDRQHVNVGDDLFYIMPST